MVKKTKKPEQDLQQLVADADTGGRAAKGIAGKLVFAIAIAWSLFQLWYASPLPFAFGWGVLNDTEVDFDPKEPLPGKLDAGQLPYDFFAVKSINEVMRALKPQNYWENVTCRMGDLRPDGVFLGNVGISGKDATLKYLVDKNWPLKDAKEGTIMCWFKPTWHSTDGQEHEFFSAVGIGDGYSARGNHLRKSGRFTLGGDVFRGPWRMEVCDRDLGVGVDQRPLVRRGEKTL